MPQSHPNRWLSEVVAGYSGLTPAERRAIHDFTLLWSLFEARLLDTSGSAARIVAAMAALRDAGHLELAPLARPLRYFRHRYANGGALSPRFEDLLLRPADRRPLVEQAMLGAPLEPAEIAAALMIIVYRLRNNLFHGLKWSYGIQDQRDNFQQASRIMMALMDMHRAGQLS